MGSTQSSKLSTQQNSAQVIDIIKKAIQERPGKQGKHYQSLFQKFISDPQTNRALGCMFGSFIGDALGSYCEFSQSISKQHLDTAMKMPAGGVFSLKSGQFTDDSQMSAHLLLGLSTFNPQQSLQSQQFSIIKEIALEYVKWLKSGPFDVGITCRKGLQKLQSLSHKFKNQQQKPLQKIFGSIYDEILNENKESQSNGSLMRITPMATFFACIGRSPSQHQKFIKNEIRLLHPKPIIQSSSFLWVNVLQKIITRPNNQPDTFLLIFKDIENMNLDKDMEEWFNKAKNQQQMAATVNMGWAKIAWSYGMNLLYKLRKQAPSQFNHQFYKDKIKTIISLGGDTDTNAGIVGGLLGAIVGFTHLPATYLKCMMDVKFPENVQDAKNQSQKRQHMYEPYSVLLSALNFIDKCQKCRQYQQGNKERQVV